MAKTVTQDPFAEIETLKQTLHERDQHIALLEEKLRLALHKRFAASTARRKSRPICSERSSGFPADKAVLESITC
jgi:hypothetical protein